MSTVNEVGKGWRWGMGEEGGLGGKEGAWEGRGWRGDR